MANAAGEDEIVWANRVRGSWLVWLSILIGLMGAFAWLSFRRPEILHGKFEAERALERFKARAQLSRAARINDPQAFRAAAIQFARLNHWCVDDELSELDEYLYGAEGAHSPPDLAEIRRKITRTRSI